MCNLYRMTSSADAIAQLFAPLDTGGANVPPLHEIFPDYAAPVIVAGEERRRLVSMQWGWPAFGQVKRPVTNIRNLASPMWRSALADPARRCVVPVTAFSEWSAQTDPLTGRKRKHWFAQCPAVRVRRAVAADPRGAALCLPDLRSQRTGRAGPPQGDAGDSRYPRRSLALAARGGRRSRSDAVPAGARGDARDRGGRYPPAARLAAVKRSSPRPVDGPRIGGRNHVPFRRKSPARAMVEAWQRPSKTFANPLVWTVSEAPADSSATPLLWRSGAAAV
jgi:hypothetical protein